MLRVVSAIVLFTAHSLAKWTWPEENYNIGREYDDCTNNVKGYHGTVQIEYLSQHGHFMYVNNLRQVRTKRETRQEGKFRSEFCWLLDDCREGVLCIRSAHYFPSGAAKTGWPFDEITRGYLFLFRGRQLGLSSEGKAAGTYHTNADYHFNIYCEDCIRLDVCLIRHNKSGKAVYHSEIGEKLNQDTRWPLRIKGAIKP